MSSTATLRRHQTNPFYEENQRASFVTSDYFLRQKSISKDPSRLLDVKSMPRKNIYPNQQLEKSRIIPNIFFTIKQKLFSLPIELRHIYNSIRESEYILDLEDSWDDEGANKTDFLTYTRAINFIIEYSTGILNITGNNKIDAPNIEILRDGSIGINWETPKASFLIIFNKKNHNSLLYAKERETGIKLSYGISQDEKIINLTLVQWMAQNLLV